MPVIGVSYEPFPHDSLTIVDGNSSRPCPQTPVINELDVMRGCDVLGSHCSHVHPVM